MTFNLYSEVERAKFLDWIDNNKDKILDYLKLEQEDLLFMLYKNQELIE